MNELFCRVITGRLDLEGKLDKSYIPAKPERPEKVDQAIRDGYKGMIANHRALRFTVSNDGFGEHVLNNITATIAAPYMTPVMNNGNRPAARGGQVKGTTSKRAIGNDKDLFISEIRIGEHYAAGAMFERWNANLTPEENTQMVNDREISFTELTRAVIGAGCTYYTRDLNKIGWSATNFDDLITLGQTVVTEEKIIEKAEPLQYEGDYTEEQAYREYAALWCFIISFYLNAFSA